MHKRLFNTVERGATFTKEFSASDVGRRATFYLLVRDPGCLTHLSTAITIDPNPTTINIPSALSASPTNKVGCSSPPPS